MVAALVAACMLACSPPTVLALDGSSHRPLAESHGKPVALVFIAHDCPICNAYAPELKRIAETYGKRGLGVELVYCEPGLSLAEARRHAHAYAYTGLKVFIDSHGILARACGATITPEAAVYDASGHRVYLGRIDDSYVALGQQRAHVTSHDLRDALDAVLGHRHVAHPRTAAVGCFIPSAT